MDTLVLNESYPELQSIAYLVFENVFGLSRAQILGEKAIQVGVLKDRLREISTRLNHHEPIQYILGEAHFFGRQFLADPSVLIPRPETEELVRLVLDHTKKKNPESTIVDIGTGSGCIAISLALEMPSSEVFATDISKDALNLAMENARRLNADVHFEEHNILQSILPLSVDVMVSNPPYITMHERNNMPRNVLEFEPGIALFVSDKDPFIFYETLLRRANESLLPDGLLAVEINEHYGSEIAGLFRQHGFRSVEIVQDVFGKNRIVKGILSS
jgi:release factor glutamine methyltransferase